MANHLRKMMNKIVQLPDAAFKVRLEFQDETCLNPHHIVIYSM